MRRVSRNGCRLICRPARRVRLDRPGNRQPLRARDRAPATCRQTSSAQDPLAIHWRRAAHCVEQARVEGLARCADVDAARNIVLVGLVCTRKSHLVTALGIEAIKRPPCPFLPSIGPRPRPPRCTRHTRFFAPSRLTPARSLSTRNSGKLCWTVPETRLTNNRCRPEKLTLSDPISTRRSATKTKTRASAFRNSSTPAAFETARRNRSPSSFAFFSSVACCQTLGLLRSLRRRTKGGAVVSWHAPRTSSETCHSSPTERCLAVYAPSVRARTGRRR
jgi:hypothetical protein